MKQMMIIAVVVAAYIALPVLAQRPEGGPVWLNGEIVRFVTTQANVPSGSGTATLYIVSGQDTAVACAGPGEHHYNGGRWAVSRVVFGTRETHYQLTSCAAVDSAVAAGDVTIARDPNADFRGPIQRGLSVHPYDTE